MHLFTILKNALLSRYFRLILSASLIGLLVSWVDLDAFVSALTNADPFYLLGAAILMSISRILMPLKWNLLLRSQNQQLSWKDSINIYYISAFFGIFLPATVGGDALRSLYTKQRGIELKDTLASIVVERLLGALTTMAFGIFGGILFILYFSGDKQSDFQTLIIVASILLVFLLATFYFTLSKPFGQFVETITRKLNQRKILPKISEKLLDLYQAYVLYRQQKKALFIFALLTLIETALPAVWSWLIALAIGIESVDIIYFCAFVPLILLITRLPISIDGFGLNEGAYVYFLSLVGVSTAAGFSIGLISHILFLACMSPGALIYLCSGKSFPKPSSTSTHL